MGGAVLLYDRNDGSRVTQDFVLDQGVLQIHFLIRVRLEFVRWFAGQGYS